MLMLETLSVRERPLLNPVRLLSDTRLLFLSSNYLLFLDELYRLYSKDFPPVVFMYISFLKYTQILSQAVGVV